MRQERRVPRRERGGQGAAKGIHMILSIGEILADMVGKKAENSVRFDCFAGGAPFNVACGIAKLGTPAAFYGCVGKDEIGAFLRGYAQGIPNLQSCIAEDAARNTTLAFVTLSEAGERSFSFFRKGTADYALEYAAAMRAAADADIVHIGSLMLSERSGRAFARKVAAGVRRLGKKVSFDVNFREDIFPDREAAKAIYAEWLERADILKLSEEEADLFFGADKENALLRLSAGRTVFVTLGKQGACLYRDGVCTRRASVAVETVDTNGAGDAFYAGALRCLDKGMTDAEAILAFANVCGALTTTRHGAADAFPSAEEVARTLREAQ